MKRLWTFLICFFLLTGCVKKQNIENCRQIEAQIVQIRPSIKQIEKIGSLLKQVPPSYITISKKQYKEVKSQREKYNSLKLRDFLCHWSMNKGIKKTAHLPLYRDKSGEIFWADFSGGEISLERPGFGLNSQWKKEAEFTLNKLGYKVHWLRFEIESRY